MRSLLIKRISALTLCFLGIAGGLPAQTAEPPVQAQKPVDVQLNSKVVGNWLGTLQAGASKMRLGFHILVNGQGELSSTLDSLDQSVTGILVRQTVFEDNILSLDIASVGARFQGTVSADGTEIAGTFVQGASRRLTLTRVDRILLPVHSQQPKPPYPYDAEDVSYSSGGVRLAGTLTLPRLSGPFPVVLLISGSGPQDRDGTVAGHKPFWVIADYLTRRGIAVLRVDDRGTGQSEGRSITQDFESFTQDVLSAVEYLKGRPDIDSKRIGVIGHSEGGTIGPMAAARSSDIAFVVMLAGPGTTGEEILSWQADAVARSAGQPESAIALNRMVQAMTVRVIRSENDPKIATQKMTDEWKAMKAELPQAQQNQLNMASIDAALARQFEQANMPELRAIVLSNPAEALRRIKVPVLALNGERDLQVPAAQNLRGVAIALAEADNQDVTTVALPGLNHLFQRCITCQVAEYGDLEETFSPDALAIVGDWVVAHTRTH
ncbi:MAG: alpha/beta fold hydrolase [Acidobacteriota bacterium]